MEKNLFLAVALSIAVLFGYDAMFIAPKRAQALKEAKVIQNKELTTNSVSNTSDSAVVAQKTTQSINITTDSNIKSTGYTANLTKMGGALHSILLPNHTQVLPASFPLLVSGFELAEFTKTREISNLTQYTYSNSEWKITKTYEVQNGNLIKSRMEITNISGISKLNNFTITALDIDSSRLDISNKRETMLDEYGVLYNKDKMLRKGSAFKFNNKESKSLAGAVEWVAFRDHFNAIIVKPEFETKSFDIKYVTDNKLTIDITPNPSQIAPGQSVVYDFSIFAGPQEPGLMKSYNKGFEKAFAFSNFPPLEWFAKAIYYTIPVIHSIFKSWGISIILISMLIYGLTYPLTMKSMMSMRKMQQVQPKIAALRDRYKNDPQKLNLEMVEIYRREKINPFGGCLPFLLQMPVFIALYQVLWRSAYFQGQGFLWIKDLSLPDRLFIMPFSLPFLGNEFNILPLLMGLVMFFQQKLSAKNMVVTDEAQLMQQKMMTMIFPVFITFIFYKFASCLSLYFTMFYLFSTLTQWKVSKVK